MQEIPSSKFRILQENEIQEIDYFDVLRELRDDWSNNIPRRIVHSTDADNRYKIRIGWWTALILSLEGAIESGMVPDFNTRISVLKFTWKYEHLFQFRDPTRKDIKEANELLNNLLRDN